MKTLLPAAVVILFASVPAAQAAPYFDRHLDRHAAEGVNQARSIRSEVRSRFSLSRDYRELMREADDLVDAMHAIHNAVHSGRSKSTLRSMVEQAQFRARNLDRRIARSDYLQASPGHRIITPTGYISYPPTHHPGRFHVDSVQRMLDRLSSNLRDMESDLQPTFRIERRPFMYGPGPYGW